MEINILEGFNFTGVEMGWRTSLRVLGTSETGLFDRLRLTRVPEFAHEGHGSSRAFPLRIVTGGLARSSSPRQ